MKQLAGKLQMLCLPLVARDSVDCSFRCLTILSMFPITFITPRVPVYVCGEGEVEGVAGLLVPFPFIATDLYSNIAVTCIRSNSGNGACKYLTKNLCLQPLITGSVNIRDSNRQKNLMSTICNWSDHAFFEKKITIWKPIRRKNVDSNTSRYLKGNQQAPKG